MTSGEKSFTKTGRMRRATFSQVCQWILTAWSSVKESTITSWFLKAGLLRDAGSTPDREAPPKRRAALIPRAPALGCTHRTRISPRWSSCDSAPWSHIQLIFQCVSWRDTLAASGENRLNAETIASRRSAALHGARQPWRSGQRKLKGGFASGGKWHWERKRKRLSATKNENRMLFL